MEDKKVITLEEVLLKEQENVYTQDLTTEDKAILNNIDTLINELRGQGVGGKDFRLYSADELSRISGSLALLKDSLVDILVKSNREKRIQEARLKLSKGNIRKQVTESLKQELEKKPTREDIKDNMEKHLFRSRARLAYLEELAERMVYKWRAMNSLLDVMQNRIHILQSQRADTGLMDDNLEVDLNNMK